jgi:hypothetical protein
VPCPTPPLSSVTPALGAIAFNRAPNYNFGVEGARIRLEGAPFRFWALLACLPLLACAWIGAAEIRQSPAFLYTEAPRYDAAATAARFPAGAAIKLVSNGEARLLAPGFAASADPTVSFDGRRVLFSGKQKPGDPWQIWEADSQGGAPRRITVSVQDTTHPFYLAGGRIVYALRTPTGWQLETMPVEGGERLRLTYAPGNHVPTEALRDGRVLFDGPHPGLPAARDLFAVYPDGSGVETIRCDHGRDRHSGRQLASGDIVFESAGRLARFTSARAVQIEIPQPAGEFAAPIAEISEAEWLVAYRPSGQGPFGIYSWRPGEAAPRKIFAAPGANALQPVLLAPHEAPKRFPSALGNREGANLLCLNVYISRSAIPAHSVATVRAWALDDAGKPVALGQVPVEQDGSFFVQAPGERAVRFELLDAAGKIVAAEKSWFWARTGEQRICVGCHAGPERAPDNAVPQILERSTKPAGMLLPVHARQAEAAK